VPYAQWSHIIHQNNDHQLLTI